MPSTFLLFGIVMGIVFAVALYPATLWVVQLTLSRGVATAFFTAVSISIAQAFLGALAGGCVLLLSDLLREHPTITRLVVSTFLVYVGCALALASAPQSVHYEGPLVRRTEIAFRSFVLALFMPIRLPAFVAFVITMNLHLRDHDWESAIILGIGIGLGSCLWLLYFVALSRFFGHRVPQDISLKSLGKLKKLAALVNFVLAGIAVFPSFTR